MFRTLFAVLCTAHIGFSSASPSRIPRTTTELSPNTLSLVLARLAEGATHSWEIGTEETALLELNAPNAFLYDGSSIPPRIHPSDDVTTVFQSVDAVLAQKPAGNKPFFNDGAAGDPCSVGIPFLLRNWTLGTGPTKYSNATDQQLYYILNVVQRTPQGAISQRAPPEPVQLWADFVSMAPPFLAYYGAITNNRTLVELAYQQISDYRDALLIDSSGLLQHIVLGGPGYTPDDPGHWSTGNGWFISGAIRVLSIIQLSSFSSSMATEKANLIKWAAELVNTAWAHQQGPGYLWNYIDQQPATSKNTSFPEASGTTLIAASTFRLATFLHQHPIPGAPFLNVAAAEKARIWSVGQVNTTTGWLQSVVNPENWRQAGSQSPEGQAFVVMLYSAHRDWVQATGGRI